jgi:hydroxyacylglutathione hydrolase
MELLSRVVGPLATNVYVLADSRTREAIAIDTAIPCLDWLSGLLTERGWRLRLIVATHGHWDHVGDNAAVQAWTREQAARLAEHSGAAVPSGETASLGPARSGQAAAPGVQDAEARIAVHPMDRHYLVDPHPLYAPFEIPPSLPAVELADRGRVRFGQIELTVLHTPGHTPGSVCLLEPDEGLLFSGDTLFAEAWGRTDLPGGSAEQMAESLARLASLEDRLRVLPGHGRATTIGDERLWLDEVRRSRRLPL